MYLVPVVVKKSRLSVKSQLNFHSFKCHGGVLNPNAVHGKGHYIRRTTGQDVGKVMEKLRSIVNSQMEVINV